MPFDQSGSVIAHLPNWALRLPDGMSDALGKGVADPLRPDTRNPSYASKAAILLEQMMSGPSSAAAYETVESGAPVSNDPLVSLPAVAV